MRSDPPPDLHGRIITTTTRLTTATPQTLGLIALKAWTFDPDHVLDSEGGVEKRTATRDSTPHLGLAVAVVGST